MSKASKSPGLQPTVAEECEICAEFTDDRTNPVLLNHLSRSGRVVASSQHFKLIPSVSPLRTGHLMVLPVFHTTSLLQLHTSLQEELLAFVYAAIRLVTNVWGSPVIAEHGVGAGQNGGCGINHAHLHICPLSDSRRPQIVHLLKTHLGVSRKTNLSDFLAEGDPRQSYLIFGTPFNLDCFERSAIPSQLFRRSVADVTGIYEWNWRDFYGWEAFDETIRLLDLAHD